MVEKLKLVASYLRSDREQAEVREFQNYKGSRATSILIASKSKSAISDFEADRDQGHLLIAIKVGQIRVLCKFRFLNVNFKWESYISLFLKARNPKPP